MSPALLLPLLCTVTPVDKFTAMRETASQLNAFGMEVMAAIPDSGANRLFSPTSLSSAMLLLLNGAAGKTEEQIRSVMHLPDSGLPAVNESASELLNFLRTPEVTISNAVFSPPSLKLGDDYLSDVRARYAATIEPLVDTEAAGVRQVNEWVNTATKHRIPQLIDHLGRNNFVLANAVTFDGQWSTPFDPANTKPLTFHAPGADQQVPTMARHGDMVYRKGDGCQELLLGYVGGHYTMRIMLPDGAVDPNRFLNSPFELRNFRNQTIDLTLPKFTYSEKMDLKPALSKVGLASIFKGGDFHRILPGQPANVSDVIQKTWIAVDEVGTKAAAATGIVMRAGARFAPTEPIPFHIDHPFAFQIVQERTGAILFAGVVKRIG